jgi:hypothetical protein
MEPQVRFDPKINDTHTQECLKRLLRVYEVENCQNREEFEAIYIIYNLGNMEALLHFLGLNKTMRLVKIIQGGMDPGSPGQTRLISKTS